MLAYILRRLGLILPTLFGIMLINFALVQFVPGGPIEQILAQLERHTSVFEGIAGGGGEIREASESSSYVGGQGLPDDFIADLERQFGFDKPPLERFVTMLWDYIRFDFGESYFRSISVTDLILEKMPVSISLGLWTTLLAYLISIPLGIRKAVRDGTAFDSWTSSLIIIGYAIPGFLFAILLFRHLRLLLVLSLLLKHRLGVALFAIGRNLPTLKQSIDPVGIVCLDEDDGSTDIV